MVTKFNFAIHVGEFLKDALDASNMKQSELANKIDVHKSIINEIIKGKRGMNVTLAQKLEAIFGLPANYWMKIQNDYDIASKNQKNKLIIDNAIIETGDYSAQDIANWFIKKYQTNIEKGGEAITNLVLQKLLYIAQGYSLGLYNKRLFNEPIEHWAHGPVVPCIYHKYKEYGKKSIDQYKDIKVDSRTESILREVFAKYSIYSAFGLVEITHKDKAWKETHQNETISDILIKESFCNSANSIYDI